jgi:hypothetical protein
MSDKPDKPIIFRGTLDRSHFVKAAQLVNGAKMWTQHDIDALPNFPEYDRIRKMWDDCQKYNQARIN